MPTTVFTGWRTVTPGCCLDCGSDDAWQVDGRGTIYCACACCPHCHLFDGHAAGCPELHVHSCPSCDAEVEGPLCPLAAARPFCYQPCPLHRGARDPQE